MQTTFSGRRKRSDPIRYCTECGSRVLKKTERCNHKFKVRNNITNTHSDCVKCGYWSVYDDDVGAYDSGGENDPIYVCPRCHKTYLECQTGIRFTE